MVIHHQLIGYNRTTNTITYESSIPDATFPEVVKLVKFDDNDPQGIGCYQLTRLQAHQIAKVAGAGVPPRELDFYLEGYSQS